MLLHNILARFRKKPRVGLRSPKRTKRLLRLCVRQNCKWAYIAVLSWGNAVTLAFAIYAIFLATAKRPAWLYTLSTGLAAVLVGIYLYESLERALKSWSHRHAQ